MQTLRNLLQYEPRPLKFGTSGRRGEVIHLTQLEVYINALAELEYLQSMLPSGGIKQGEDFYFAYDLRPSSTQFIAEAGGRGELAQAIWRAIEDAGMTPINLGAIPTPALAAFALAHGKGSIMITGSHIPFDRNGYKTNSARGELLKKDEEPINRRVEHVRTRLYEQAAHESLFNADGMFKTGHRDLPPENPAGRRAYARRYLNFFAGQNLAGMRLLVYQHSAVGRDLLVEILQALGATVLPAGRSEVFVPIDTENMDAALLAGIQSLVDAADGPVDAVISADGDSDRPLLLGVTAEGQARFFGGDLLGLVAAEYLGADAVVVPISCNDAIDRGALRERLQPKTRIGSPYVIAGMEQAAARGFTKVCGWEANGGFLTGSGFEQNGRLLPALPTRDAMLPLLCTLFAARKHELSVCDLFARLPRRFSKAALLKNFPRTTSLAIIAKLTPIDDGTTEVVFGTGEKRPGPWAEIQAALTAVFRPALGFGNLVKINYTDGVRLYFDNGDVAHVRPSGNADELRIYAVADAPERAEAIAAAGVAEPDGLLRQLEKLV
jgi:phosphomannomutase